MRILKIGLLVFVLIPAVAGLGIVAAFPLFCSYTYHARVRLQKKQCAQMAEYWKDPRRLQSMRDWLATYFATHETPRSESSDWDLPESSEWPACVHEIKGLEDGVFWPLRYFLVDRKMKAAILMWNETDNEFGILIALDEEEAKKKIEKAVYREYIEIGENAWAWRNNQYD